jgi:uncharacterized surface protein with fasciclin (FAS1) repeats
MVVVAVVAGSPFVGAAYGQCGSETKDKVTKVAAKDKMKDIVDTAVGAGDFGTLVAAVKAAGLVETLKSDGPLTVFAPTDAAFARLPKGTVEALLKDPAKLRSILKYHVVAGKVMAADVIKLESAMTVLGQKVNIDTSKGVRLNNAMVTATDIACRNGVIHVIDAVLLPADDIIDIAKKAGGFNTLLTAIEAAGLEDTLRGEGPFTVFAPTDEAFAKLPEGTIEALLKDKKKLASILTYHVVPGKVMAADVVKLHEAKTVQGSSVRISSSSAVRINDAKVLKTDIETANGVIHVIDTVILPPEK